MLICLCKVLAFEEEVCDINGDRFQCLLCNHCMVFIVITSLEDIAEDWICYKVKMFLFQQNDLYCAKNISLLLGLLGWALSLYDD